MKRRGITSSETTAVTSEDAPSSSSSADPPAPKEEIALADWVKSVEEHLNVNLVRMKDDVHIRLSESEDISSDSEVFQDTQV